MRDISDPSGETPAAPAPERIHALHLSDGQVACDYFPGEDDIPDRQRDWFTVPQAEVPCEKCRGEIQLAKG